MLTLDLKNDILTRLRISVKNELELANLALASSRDLMSQDDMKPEGKYDTRRTEVGYLVQAQGKRALELKSDFEILENFVANQTHKVEIGSLLQILNTQTDENKIYFICPTQLGVILEIDQQKIHVISFKSPMAQACVTLTNHDFFEMQSPKGDCEYQIINLL